MSCSSLSDDLRHQSQIARLNTTPSADEHAWREAEGERLEPCNSVKNWTNQQPHVGYTLGLISDWLSITRTAQSVANQNLASRAHPTWGTDSIRLNSDRGIEEMHARRNHSSTQPSVLKNRNANQDWLRLWNYTVTEPEKICNFYVPLK